MHVQVVAAAAVAVGCILSMAEVVVIGVRWMKIAMTLVKTGRVSLRLHLLLMFKRRWIF